MEYMVYKKPWSVLKLEKWVGKSSYHDDVSLTFIKVIEI